MMSDHRNSRPSFLVAILVFYGLGLLGWTWDWLEHLGVSQFGEKPAHLVMYLSGVVVVALSLAPQRGPLRYFLAYGWLLAGVGLLMGVNPLLGAFVLLPLPLYAAWVRAKSSLGGWAGLAAGGVTLVLLGVGIDWLWHQANPSVLHMGFNTLFQPGHALQLAGWLLGLCASAVTLARASAGTLERASAGTGS
jgi:hypothetical protein